ncbi:MAG: hypothetical protein P8J20_07940 [Novosphingobium sp.]|nr:hypothetical protein [Novosphingobium sp.]
MSFAAAFMTPLALLMPASGGAEVSQDRKVEFAAAQTALQPEPRAAQATSERPAKSEFVGWSMHVVVQNFEPEPAQQVRIQQRVTIRIVPRGESSQQSMIVDLPNHAIGPRFVERKIVKCLKVARISGVQTDSGNRLLLFMNDRRIVSAMLERACRARDYYSGFYLSKSNDGKLCVARDKLQSRSGANCKLTQLRELVEVDD